MIKTAILGTAIVFGAAAPIAPTAPLADNPTTPAEQTALNLPATDAIVAQFSYLEISHSEHGFGLSITDNADIFVDFEFSGNLHIRIGF